MPFGVQIQLVEQVIHGAAARDNFSVTIIQARAVHAEVLAINALGAGGHRKHEGIRGALGIGNDHARQYLRY